MERKKVDIRLVHSPSELEKAFRIREEVYIKEQRIKREDEFDEWDQESRQFIALVSGVACGTARWRTTPEGAKMERFAVLKKYRGRGIASALVKNIVKDIHERKGAIKMYLYAQVDVKELYQKEGFKPEGDIFVECSIPHQLMVLEESSNMN